MTNKESQLSVIDIFNNKEQIEVMKKTVAEGATDVEFAMFAHLAQKYDLDPFSREIYFVKYGNKTTLITSRDGYLKIAQSNPQFDGLQSSAVYPDDEFDFDIASGTVRHKINVAKVGEKNPIGAWAICHHKSRKPTMAFVRFHEYKKTSQIWSQYPSVMIAKVAEVIVLKRQFGINGLITQEELGTEDPEQFVKDMPKTPENFGKKPEVKTIEVEKKPVIPANENKINTSIPLINEHDRKKFFAVFTELWDVMKKHDPIKWTEDLKEDFRKATISKLSGKEGLTDNMTVEDMEKIIDGMKEVIKKFSPEETLETAKEVFNIPNPHCEDCGVEVNEKTVSMCKEMKEFKGKIYCFKCQAKHLS